MELKDAIAVFDKSAERTRPNAQTEAWKVIRAALSPAGEVVPFGHYFRDMAGNRHFHTGRSVPCFAKSDITPLYAAPRAAEAVTDEQVEAFARVYWKGDWPFKPDTEATRELMAEFRDVIKRGLTAALTPPSAKGE